MIYQSQFQRSEPPSKSHLSCSAYHSDENGNYPLHCHSYYEISFIISGERWQLFNGKKYHIKKNTLFLIPPLVMHGNDNITDIEDIVLQFSASFLSSLSTIIRPEMKLVIDSELPFIELCETDNAYDVMKKLALNSEKEKKLYQNEAWDLQLAAAIECERNSLVFELFSSLVADGKAHFSEKNSNLTKLNALNDIISYITNNPKCIPDMNTAAQMANISYYNFSRIFKEATGMNYSEYTNTVRIGHAEGLLMNSDLTIAEIAEAIGVDTPSYFTKLFKQVIGFSPTEYRRMYKGT